eukprot:1655780-Rhodomonas_salina.3
MGGIMLTGVVCASCLPLAKTLRSFGVAVDAYETAAPTFARSRSQQRGCDRFSLTDAANAAVTVHGMAHSLPLPKMGVCPPPPLVLVPVVGFQCKTPKNLGHISVDTTYKNVNRRFYDTRHSSPRHSSGDTGDWVRIVPSQSVTGALAVYYPPYGIQPSPFQQYLLPAREYPSMQAGNRSSTMYSHL